MAFGGIFSKFFKAEKVDVNELATQIAGASIAKFKSQMLGYSGGGNVYHYLNTPGRSGGAKYPFGITESGGLSLDHYRLRINARDAYHDTPQARAFVERFADTVADVGLTLEPAPQTDILGITMEQGERWASDVEVRYDAWASDVRQHRSEVLNWYQSQRLYQIGQHRDGENFIRLYYSSDRRLVNPLQFEYIDPFQIRGDAYTATNYVNGIQDDGIKRDERGRENAYKIWVSKGVGKYDHVVIPKIGPKSNRLFMIHSYIPEYAGQGRGYSRLAYALQEFENLTDFSLSTIKKAINQSQVHMYVKPSTDAPASNPMEGILTGGGAGPAASSFGVDSEATSETTIPAEGINPVKFYSMPEATMEVPGSTAVFNLAAGEDLRAFENKTDAESFGNFVDSFCSYLCAAGSMPIEVLLMKFNQNYSASRGTLILFWRIVTRFREDMVASFCNPMYKMWLSGEVAAGRISCPGWSDPRLQAAWLNSRWIGSPMPNIDPEKTAQADKHYVEMAAQTLDRVARNYNGSSGKANRAKLKREISELTKVPWSKGAEEKPKDKDGNDDS